ncbi:amylosucrase [Leifsonia sp. AG29]|uniref:amylosucrase n=1 Tax=Leifsonia sp. AG29 TaxID=2598860 RepID=UPI00131CF3CD|nr:amylosucrase [Leifsonia sp. AG29]
MTSGESGIGSSGGDDFEERFRSEGDRLARLLGRIYGDHPALAGSLEAALRLARTSWEERSPDLKELDRRRLEHPDWFLSNDMLGGFCYADLYAGGMAGLRERIPYFRELGLTYLHVMPPFKVPEGNSDGGYAVSSYRELNPRLGTITDLRLLGEALRASGISLAVDFVFNHTASDHEWARRAAAGDPVYRDYYWMFDTRELPDAFEATTREIFPDDHPGSFVQLDDGTWVWASFHSFQWDLNYANPAVFVAMAGEMLFLANQGVEVLRMDAVPFIWKQLGTSSENLPQAHLLLQAFNAVCRIAAPAMLFLSEAIVHPDDVVGYVRPDECQLSYNPLQMALTWEALATRDVRLLHHALAERHRLPDGTAWVNYVRSHDDIGWTFADEDAVRLGIDPSGHRRFLNDYYTGRFEGSFSRGVAFQFNPKTGDSRVSGATASLLGLESGDAGAIDRILLAYSLALSTGGIPLLFLGDEVGQLNDYGQLEVEGRSGDSRWVGRPNYPARLYSERNDPSTDAGKVYSRMRRLIQLRKENSQFAGGELRTIDSGNSRILAFERPGGGKPLLVLANVGDYPEQAADRAFADFPGAWTDLISRRSRTLGDGVALAAHEVLWLVRA